MRTTVLPSVFEATTAEITDVAEGLATGLKIEHDGRSYIIGELAVLEGSSPHKGINNTPSDLDYQLLLQAALSVAAASANAPLYVTTGFPPSLYSVYREEAKNLIQGEHLIELDGRPFGGVARSMVEVDVRSVDVIPEIEGVTTAIREGGLEETDPFFAVNLGYGTFETVLNLPSGNVQRTLTSVKGIRVATQRIIERLQQELRIETLTEHQIDMAMQDGYIIAGRERVDITDLRHEVLQTYYDDVVSPAIEKAFSDSDFGRSGKMYIAGGGACYDTLAEAFQEEFGNILDVNILSNPHTTPCEGYALNSGSQVSDDEVQPVGIDIGNANTVVVLA